MPAISLEDLNQRIAQREQELEALRQELASRRNQYTALTRRKKELQTALRQVEAEIDALSVAQPPPSPSSPKSEGGRGGTAAAPPAAPTAPPSSPKAGGGRGGDRPKMGDLILSALRESGKAMTARQLSEEVRRRGFPLSGAHPVKSVESRLQEMKQKRLVRRASGQPGYVLVSSSGGKADKPKTVQPTSSPERKAPVKPAQPGPQGKQPSLRQVLLNVLKSSRKFLSGNELAEMALASGYKSNSTNFVDAVWAMLGQMEDVEHVRGKGYRLKKG